MRNTLLLFFNGPFAVHQIRWRCWDSELGLAPNSCRMHLLTIPAKSVCKHRLPLPCTWWSIKHGLWSMTVGCIRYDVLAGVGNGALWCLLSLRWFIIFVMDRLKMVTNPARHVLQNDFNSPGSIPTTAPSIWNEWTFFTGCLPVAWGMLITGMQRTAGLIEYCISHLDKSAAHCNLSEWVYGYSEAFSHWVVRQKSCQCSLIEVLLPRSRNAGWTKAKPFLTISFCTNCNAHCKQQASHHNTQPLKRLQPKDSWCF